MLVNRRVAMVQRLIALMLCWAFVFGLSGCATSSSRGLARTRHHVPRATQREIYRTEPPNSPHKPSGDASASPPSGTQLVAHQEEAQHANSQPDLTVPPVVTPEEQALTLQDLEAMAMANNPTLVQATAQIQAAQGAAYQAGLCPNPVIGYTGEQMGVNGTAGETQGGFVFQEFVTGGKLRLSRAKWAQQARIAQTNFHIQQHRVLNDVRSQFYRTLAAQNLVEIHGEIVANGEDNLQTHREMLNLGQTNQSGLLRAEVDLERDRLNLKQAEYEFQHAWRTLVALVGIPELEPVTLTGTLEPDEQPLEWETAVSQVLSSSPELQAAWQKIRHDQIMVERERVQPIPNLLTDVTVGRNFESQNTTTTVNIGIPLPIFDRNQGTVQQAQADLNRSHAEARRLELELRTRLAQHYRDYETAWQHVQDYQATMLPKAQQSYELLHESYKARRAAWPDVLTAQRLYLSLRSEYVANLLAYRESDVAIRGMLLTGGLTQPPSPVGNGHIDAVPKPR